MKKEKNTETTEKRFLFCCASPLQLMAAINIVYNDIESSKNFSDLVICHSFKNSQIISEKIKEMKIFNHVYDLKFHSLSHGSQAKLWRKRADLSIWNILARSNVKRLIKSNLKYDIIAMSNKIQVFAPFYKAFPNAEIIFFDDGLGSYFGSIDAASKSILKKIFVKYILRDKMTLNKNLVKRLYVHSKEICKSSLCKDIRELPTLNKNSKCVKILYEAFNYNNIAQYKNYKFIYLSCPAPSVFTEEYLLMNNIKNVVRDNLIVRVHPQDTPARHSVFHCDSINNLWELQCIDEINENHVLLSSFSTAQITPKIISKVEPYIIFMYKLFSKDALPEEKNEWDIFVNNTLIPFYSKPEKIFVPSTIKELYEILNNLK